MRRRQLLFGAGAAMAAVPAGAAPRSSASGFDLAFANGRLTRLREAGDRFGTDYLTPGLTLGDIRLALRQADGGWLRLLAGPGGGGVVDAVLPSGHGHAATVALDGAPALRLTSVFALEDGALRWTVTLENLRTAALEIGDLALPLPMNSRFSDKRPLTSFALKHSFISGAGSFFYWMRANSVGPFLLMLPDPGCGFSYWDHHNGNPFQAYIHSGAVPDALRETGGTWRLPLAGLTLGSRGGPNSSVSHTMRFLWADGHDGVRDLLARHGSLDVQVVPGMTIPTGWDATIAFRSTLPVSRIEAEHGADTAIERLPDRVGRQLFRVRFARLGENRLAVTQPGRGTTWLEFFVTEPIETLIAKRAAFIARHQHRDPGKWYDGLLAEWNAETGVMLGPDNYDRIKGWRIYEVTCDDPGLSKPAFLASKNAHDPVQAEVDALDLYIRRFVWGGLQRTTAESHPYGIYGIPDWKTNRDSADPGPKGRLHIWRPYDYPHIICLYLGMWRVAHHHRHVRTELAAADYLDRAAGTAIAMFTVPKEVVGWSAYETGFYNECVIPELIAILEEEGRTAQAATLRGHWERKVAFFVRGNPNLFGSEYAFDSTGFESTQAIADYALVQAGKGGALAVTAEEARRFAATTIAANIFCRGSIEPAYYLLGSDYRAGAGDGYTLSYMAQMGGAAILSYGLGMAAEPAPYLRLGYQSFLSSWALVNSGTAASGHGYWFPGAGNDGSAGGGFEPAAYGHTWLDQPHHRGSWYYSCEIDLGFCGALRSAATILLDDPIFGRICLGGTVEQRGAMIEIFPRDGLLKRLHVRLEGQTLDLVLEGDRFAADVPIRIVGRTVEVSIHSDNPEPHVSRLLISGRTGEHARILRKDGKTSNYTVAGNTISVPLEIGAAPKQRTFSIDYHGGADR